MSEPVVEVRGLTRRFGSITAVDNVSFQVHRSEIFGLVGPDGAGKTTILRLILGLLEPTAGEVFVAGYDLAREPEAVKDCAGYMAQRFGLYDDLTVNENMEFFADVYGIPHTRRQELKPHLLRMTRMEAFRNRQAGKLSGGMKQKLALMCTLLHPTEVLFLDEPTNGVDPVSRREFWNTLYQLVKQGISVFLTTSYLDEAERCNRVGLLHGGRLIRCDTPETLRRQVPHLCYEIEAEDLEAARRFLRGLEGVVSVEPFGSALHLLLDPQRTSLDRLAEAIGPARTRQIPPSLEDAFFALLHETTPS